MLDTQVPFPQVRSFALLPEPDRAPQLARIEYHLTAPGDGRKPEDHWLTISLPFVDGAASGARRVKLAELVDGTPLTAAEAAELSALAAKVAEFNHGRGPKLSRKKQARHDALTDRETNARLLATLLDRLPAHQRRQRYARAA